MSVDCQEASSRNGLYSFPYEIDRLDGAHRTKEGGVLSTDVPSKGMDLLTDGTTATTTATTTTNDSILL